MKRIINILLLEDDTLDQIEVTRTLNKRNILHRLQIAKAHRLDPGKRFLERHKSLYPDNIRSVGETKPQRRHWAFAVS